MTIGERIYNLFVAADQLLFNLACLGQAHPSETASSAAWRLEQLGYWQGRFFRPIIDWLAWVFFHDPDHCRVAYENTIAGKFLPPKLPEKSE